MNGSGDQRNGGGGSSGTNGVETAIVICLFLAMLLWMLSGPLSSLMARLARVELTILNGLLGWAVSDFQVALTWMDRARAAHMTPTYGVALTLLAIPGRYIGFAVSGWMAWLAWKAWSEPVQHMNRSMTWQRLLQIQSKRWKAVVPVLHRNLLNDTSPDWAPMRKPSKFAKDLRLVIGGTFEAEKARTAFLEQLGEKWDGPHSLSDHEKALFAIFGLRILRKKAEAQQLLDDLNESCRGTGIPNFRVADSAFKLIAGSARVLAFARPHDYRRTVLCTLYQEARRYDGKLAPCWFYGWLKPLDRTLHYALLYMPLQFNVYSHAVPIEGAGVYAQWQAEKVSAKLGRRLTGPLVEHAVVQLEEELRSVGMLPPRPKPPAPAAPVPGTFGPGARMRAGAMGTGARRT